ncbi:MAG: energy transducer TonB [Betaproteobacteria bacterium]|nr:energy transducer TonB [Betaproteobacteria bacterium]
MGFLDTWLDRLGLGERFARLPHHDFTTLVIRHRPDQERYYPEVSRLARESGSARLLLAVAPDGVPYRVRLLESSGHLRLDEAALRLALDFRFASPAGQDDASARSRWQTTLRVTFVDPHPEISPATR